MCTGENPFLAHKGVSTGWDMGWREQLSMSWSFKHRCSAAAAAAAANTLWKRCALSQGSWEQLVRGNDRRMTPQGKKKERQDLL